VEVVESFWSPVPLPCHRRRRIPSGRKQIRRMHVDYWVRWSASSRTGGFQPPII